MALFSSKNKKEEPVQLGQSDESDGQDKKMAKIRTIPEVFYGGNDPEIYKGKKKAKKEIEEKMKKQESQEKKSKERSDTEEQNKKQNEQQVEEDEAVEMKDKNSPQSKDNKWIKIGGSVAGIVLLIVGTSSYYFYQAGFFTGLFNSEQVSQEQSQEDIGQQPTLPEPSGEQEPDLQEPDEQVVATTSTPTSTQESSTTTTPTTTLQLEEQTLSFPDVILSDSVDLDSDDLTDKEEGVFDTDSGTWDTDGDGYYDGQEIRNLYHPEGSAPTKLIDSGLVSEYVNPVWQYRLYYPNTWKVASVDDNYRQVLFSSITGDFVEVRVEPKQEGETFDDWFARRIEGQNRTDISQFSNRFGEEGYKRNDNLVSYFVGEDNVYVIIYNTGTTGEVPFRNIMRMAFESFRPVSNNEALPEQNVLPEVNQTSSQRTETTTQISTTTEVGTSTQTVSTSTTST